MMVHDAYWLMVRDGNFGDIVTSTKLISQGWLVTIELDNCNCGIWVSSNLQFLHSGRLKSRSGKLYISIGVMIDGKWLMAKTDG